MTVWEGVEDVPGLKPRLRVAIRGVRNAAGLQECVAVARIPPRIRLLGFSR